jgi:tetratricopeptide (TPR) repeat protein
MVTLTAKTTPLDFAVHANQLVKEKFEQAGRDHEAITFDMNLQRIAVEYARKGDFTQAFKTCEEISYGFTMIRALMEIGCEMLMAGKEEPALKTIELALENARNQAEGFPEENLLAYLDTIQGFGHTALVHSILALALSRLEQHDNGVFCLSCYRQLLPQLAIHWREKAEELVDHILALRSRFSLDENLHLQQHILIDISMLISRYNLLWNEERKEHCARHLEHLQSVDIIELARSSVRFAEVWFKKSECDHQARYIHKYYLPQELRTNIFPVDISGIENCFYRDSDFGLWEGRAPEYVPDCVIQYKDIGLDKHIDAVTVRRVLLSIAAYHTDTRAELSPEENLVAMNLNNWFIKWEKDLLSRCMQVARDMELQVRSGDSWMSDYEIDVETQFYVRDGDPFSEDNMPDASYDDIDSDVGMLCSMKHLVNGPIFHSGSEYHWGIWDDRDHNDRPRGTRSEEIYNVRHCATFHELFDHMCMPVKHAGRIGRVYTDIIVQHQNGFHIDLKREQTVAVRDEPRIREGLEI